MSKANWADAESDDDIEITPEDVLQDQLLSQMEDSRGGGKPKQNRSRAGSELSTGSGGRRGGGQQRGGSGGNMQRDRRKENEDTRRQQGNDRRGGVESIPDNGPYKASVGNLNFHTSAKTLAEFFIDGRCDVTDVQLDENADGRKNGYGHVTFSDRDSLVKALTADGVELEGRNIRVYIDKRGQFNNRRGGPEPSRADEADKWDRGQKRQPRTGGRSEGDAEGGRREGGSGGGSGKSRPVINIAPRSIPVEATTGDASRSSSIFGDAKPRDDRAYEEARQKRDGGSGKGKGGSPRDGDKPRKDFAKKTDGAKKKDVKEIKPKGKKDKKSDEEKLISDFNAAQLNIAKTAEAPVAKKNSSSNVFAALGDDSDEDD
jgi:RNA recognition motif-containing protein